MFELYNDLRFLPEGMIVDIAEKFVANLHDKKEYVIHIRNLKQALNHKKKKKKCIETLNLINNIG